MSVDRAPSNGGRAMILVVERDPHVRRLERYFLEEAGYDVEFAADGREGLELARRSRPDVVISEILLPGMDGLAVCRALKSDPATRSMIVLIFSILSAELRAVEAGADGFLRKPLDDARMVRFLDELLRRQREDTGAGDATS